MCACTYVHVCWRVCVEPRSHALTMLHCPLDPNSNLCKDSFFPLSHPSLFSIAFVALPFFFSPSPLWIPLIRTLTSLFSPSRPSLSVLSDGVHLLLFLSLCHSSTLLYLRLLLCLPFFSPPSLSSRIDLHFFLLQFAVPLSLLSPLHTMHSLDSFILCLVSCPPPLGWTDTRSCKK